MLDLQAVRVVLTIDDSNSVVHLGCAVRKQNEVASQA